MCRRHPQRVAVVGALQAKALGGAFEATGAQVIGHLLEPRGEGREPQLERLGVQRALDDRAAGDVLVGELDGPEAPRLAGYLQQRCGGQVAVIRGVGLRLDPGLDRALGRSDSEELGDPQAGNGDGTPELLQTLRQPRRRDRRDEAIHGGAVPRGDRLGDSGGSPRP